MNSPAQNSLRAPFTRVLRRAGRVLAAVLAAALLIAAFCLVIVLCRPDPSEPKAVQPLLPAGQALTTDQSGRLGELLSDFPAPVLLFLPGAGPEFSHGNCYDTPFEHGFARVADLFYTLPDGSSVRACTIYPARALPLIGRGGYDLTGRTATLCGIQMIRMESASNIRLHGAGEQAVYLLELPRTDPETLTLLLRTAQLTDFPGDLAQ